MILLLLIVVICNQYDETRTYAVELDDKKCNDILPVSNITASNSKPGFPPTNVIDNSSSSRWINKGNGSWIQMDLGTVQNVCGVDIAWYNGSTRVYNFVLATSIDGAKFNTKINTTSSGNTSESEKISINASSTRFLRLTINGNNQNDYASLSDIKVYGIPRPGIPGQLSFPTINVATDRIKYVEGQSVTIFGSAIDQLGKPLKAPLTIKVQQYVENLTTRKNETLEKSEPGCNIASVCKNASPRLVISANNILDVDESRDKKFSLFTVYSASLIPNGTYHIVLNKGLMPGKYNITSYVPHASAKAFNISNIGTLSTTLVKVETWWISTPFLILVGGGLTGIVGLSTVLWKGSRIRPTTSYVPGLVFWKAQTSTSNPGLISNNLLEFIFLSIIAFTPIATLALTDVALFPDAPVGIIIKPSTLVKSENVTQSIGEWMINIGGTSSDKYKAGIQIPVAIFIFGILGGYLRYLFSKAHPQIKPEQTELEGSIRPFNAVLQDLILLFLSPLLAIAVWLVLFQGGTTSPLTLAAVSFAIGLATKQATEWLISFIEKIFSPSPKPANTNHG